MAAMMEDLYETALQNYHMTLLAGEGGICRLVDWVHVVEEIEYVVYLKGRELVITTGIKEPDEELLLEFTRRVYNAQASGLVINVGKYIPKVPESVRQFGAEHDFPIFSLPWEVHLVDFNRELCNLIYQSEKEYATLYSAVHKAVFHPEEAESCQEALCLEGLADDTPMRLIQCYLPLAGQGHQSETVIRFYSRFYQYCQDAFRREKHRFIVLRNGLYVTAVIFGLDAQAIRAEVKKLRKFCDGQGDAGPACLAVSGSDTAVVNLSEKYQVTSLLCRWGAKEGTPLAWEEECGVWRLLLEITDRGKLERYKNRILGELEQLDGRMGTEYMKILEAYLRENGNIQETAAQCYLHRNTVTYHLKKIAEVTGKDLSQMADRNELYLAFQIKKILEL